MNLQFFFKFFVHKDVFISSGGSWAVSSMRRVIMRPFKIGRKSVKQLFVELRWKLKQLTPSDIINQRQQGQSVRCKADVWDAVKFNAISTGARPFDIIMSKSSSFIAARHRVVGLHLQPFADYRRCDWRNCSASDDCSVPRWRSRPVFKYPGCFCLVRQQR